MPGGRRGSSTRVTSVMASLVKGSVMTNRLVDYEVQNGKSGDVDLVEKSRDYRERRWR